LNQEIPVLGLEIVGRKAVVMTKYVYDFSEGDKDQKDLLGGKGAN
jgi:hypothetical protein